MECSTAPQEQQDQLVAGWAAHGEIGSDCAYSEASFRKRASSWPGIGGSQCCRQQYRGTEEEVVDRIGWDHSSKDRIWYEGGGDTDDQHRDSGTEDRVEHEAYHIWLH